MKLGERNANGGWGSVGKNVSLNLTDDGVGGGGGRVEILQICMKSEAKIPISHCISLSHPPVRFGSLIKLVLSDR